MTTTTFKLTEDQAKAITKMKEFCAYPEHKFFRLTGYAGTGKSFTICQLISWLQDKNLLKMQFREDRVETSVQSR